MIKWTEDAIKKEALNYQHRAQFAKNSNSAYYKAIKLGILDEVCSHMKPASRTRKWTKQSLLEEAAKYENITSFRKGSRIAYETALRNGVIEDIRKIIKPGKKDKWSFEELKEISSKYRTRISLRNDHAGVYKAIKQRGLEKELLSHMPKQKKWSEEDLQKTANKYKTRGDFLKQDGNAYNAARERGILDKICNHMKPSGHFYKRCVYICEFKDGSIYVGITFSVRERMIRRQKDPSDAVTKYYRETGIEYTVKQISGFMPLKEAALLEEKTRQKYLKEGRNVLNRTKCGSAGATYGTQNRHKKIVNFNDGKITKTPYNKKPVKITDLNTGKIFNAESIREASNLTGIKPPCICNECKGKSKAKGNYKFEYNCNAENYLL